MVSATFLAYSCRVSSVFAAASNPADCPQPPTARQSLVPVSKRLRTWSGAMKGLYQVPELKMTESANAVVTCVTPAVTEWSGKLSLCHLERVMLSSSNSVHSRGRGEIKGDSLVEIHDEARLCQSARGRNGRRRKICDLHLEAELELEVGK